MAELPDLRRPACAISPDSDLGRAASDGGVSALAPGEIAAALDAGLRVVAEDLRRRGLIHAAALFSIVPEFRKMGLTRRPLLEPGSAAARCLRSSFYTTLKPWQGIGFAPAPHAGIPVFRAPSPVTTSPNPAHAAAPAATIPTPLPAGVHAERVVSVEHHTDRLFSFRITRPASLRFRSGEFVMIGLPGREHEKPLFRAYSVASPAWDEELEFYSIKVPDGPLTARLQKIKPGDAVLLRPRPTGTLVIDALLPGRRLFMLSTGTGLAPFASIVRDPESYERFGELILTHTARTKAELAYGERLAQTVADDPLIGEFAGARFRIYQSTTREPGERTGRITALIESGKLFADLGIAPFDPAHDRIMICGSMAMIRDLKALAEKFGFTEGSLSRPGSFVVERAFAG